MEQLESGHGWIGAWSPGIGDPSIGGWLTVLLYVLAAGVAGRVAWTGRGWCAANELWFWRILVALLIALGINKQLDLQTAFTEVGRIVAREQGWYEDRRSIQRVFILAMALVSVLVVAGAILTLWRTPGSTKLTLMGATCLLLFVAVRASSFHHMDHFLGTKVLGLRWNWILEVGGLAVILLGTLRRWRSRTT